MRPMNPEGTGTDIPVSRRPGRFLVRPVPAS